MSPEPVCGAMAAREACYNARERGRGVPGGCCSTARLLNNRAVRPRVVVMKPSGPAKCTGTSNNRQSECLRRTGVTSKRMYSTVMGKWRPAWWLWGSVRGVVRGGQGVVGVGEVGQRQTGEKNQQGGKVLVGVAKPSQPEGVRGKPRNNNVRTRRKPC